MKTFSFKRSKIKVETESGEYEVRFPALPEANEFDRELSEGKRPEDEVIRDYFERLGLPQKGYDELESWQVREMLYYFRDPLGKLQPPKK